MLRAPLLCAYPDLSLPAPNDCWYFTHLLADVCHGVPPGPAFYELGYAWTGAADFAAVLQRAYAEGQRDSLDALLFGVDDVPHPPLADAASVFRLPSSVLLPASGLAVLRTPSLHLLLKYGPHGGGHGHPDKLAVAVYAHGRRLSPDLGTPGYGLDLFTSWYRQTLSHNTVVIEGQSQPEATGELVAFQPDGPVQVAAARVAWEGEGPYGAVRLRRALLVHKGYWLDLSVVECPEPRQTDWVYRNVGRLDLDAPDPTLGPSPSKGGESRRGEVTSPLPTGDGYQHITGAAAYAPTAPYTATWQAEGIGLRVWAKDAPGETVITGSVPGYPPTERQALLLRRRHAQATAFVALCQPLPRPLPSQGRGDTGEVTSPLLSPFPGREGGRGVRSGGAPEFDPTAPAVQAVTWRGDLENGGLVCHVQTRVGVERWTLRFDADLQYTFEEIAHADPSGDAARPA